ncbi:MAG: Rho termination factor N-terminal domain-containing protein [Solirubrobacteraceae bacterium]
MSVLDRAELEQSPLADLHTLASEFSIDGYRRLRRAELIDRILGRHLDDPDGAPLGDSNSDLVSASGSDGSTSSDSDEPTSSVSDQRAAVDADQPGEGKEGEAADQPGDGEEGATPRRRRGRRSTRARSDQVQDAPPAQDGLPEPDAATVPDEADRAAEKSETKAPPKPRKAGAGRAKTATPRAKAGGRAKKPDEAQEAAAGRSAAGRPAAGRPAAGRAAAEGRGAGAARRTKDDERDAATTEADDGVVEGVVELLASGSGFVRVQPPEPSDDDVYISATQVKRCELVTGDRISGPRRAPRRSERFASLLRVDTINGRPSTEVADGARFDDLPAAFPSERFRLGSEDPTVKAIEWLTPIGRGSRVTIVGGARAGKSEALRRLAVALAGDDGLQVSVALAGVRPEEISEWSGPPAAPAAAISFAFSPDVQGQAVETVLDQARRIAARGADAVVLVDTLDGLPSQTARRVLACARNIVDGGSLTVIATSAVPIGGETTVIALDDTLASIGRFPALDLTSSGTMRPERLVGDAGAEAIARARAQAIDS